MSRPVVLALLALLATHRSDTFAAQEQKKDEKFEFPEAAMRARVGQTTRVCGVVVEYSCKSKKDTQLDLGTIPSELGASVRVPGTSRSRFPLAFEGRALSRQVCATGPVSLEGRRFIVLLEDPASFSMTAPAEPENLPPDLASPCDQGVVFPKLLKEVKPVYDAAAYAARIEGVVHMDTIVGVDGRPGFIRVIRSVDRRYGLDRAAVSALQQWRFTQGLREGRPVPVRLQVDIAFTRR